MQQTMVWTEEELIERLANWITRRGLVTPAIFLLETNKPFTFLGSQLLLMVQPFLGPVAGYDRIGALARLMEDRTNVEHLLARLESCRVNDGSSPSTDDAMP